jgi:hypothetical protein
MWLSRPATTVIQSYFMNAVEVNDNKVIIEGRNRVDTLNTDSVSELETDAH